MNWLKRWLMASKPRRRRLHCEPLEDRIVPDARPLPIPIYYFGAGYGSAPMVRAYQAETNTLTFERQVYELAFTGGVRVATADFTRDGWPDLVVAAGPEGGPRVRVLDGITGETIPGPLGDFYAYETDFSGGVTVAAADVDGDSVPDLITAAGSGGGPRVRVFSGTTGIVLADFFAYDEHFQGGVSIAAADFTGDGKADLVLGAGPGGGPHVRVLDVSTGQSIPGPLGSFFAFDPAFTHGVHVGTDAHTGDVDNDGTADLVIGSGGTAQVLVFSGKTGVKIADFLAADNNTIGGVHVGTAYVTDDSFADIVTAVNVGGADNVRVFAGATGKLIDGPFADFVPFEQASLGGLNVAASNDPPIVSVTKITDGDEQSNAPVKFTIQRSGSGEQLTTKLAVTVSFTGVTADIAQDIIKLPTVVTIPVGSAEVEVEVPVVNDPYAEYTETYTLTIVPSHTYDTIRVDDTYTLTIKDTASPDTATESHGDAPQYSQTVGDFVWHDADADGFQDSGEPGLRNVLVHLYDETGYLDSRETDGDGKYSFAVGANTPYQLHFENPDEEVYTFTEQFAAAGYPTKDSNPLKQGSGHTPWFLLAPNASDDTQDAGLTEFGSIGDRVWYDADAQGDQDAEENGIAGVVVQLLAHPSGKIGGSDVTDSLGNYYFEEVFPGEYKVKFDNPNPSLYIFTTANNTNDVEDSDAGYDGVTLPIMLVGGQNIVHVDAGTADKPVVTIVATTPNTNEPSGLLLPAPGLFTFTRTGDLKQALTVVYHTNWGTATLGADYTSTPDETGEITFTPGFPQATISIQSLADGKVEGNETVRYTILPSSAYNIGDPGTATVTIADSNDFMIGDFVWNDINADGLQGGEPGVHNVTVKLFKQGVTDPVATTSTDANGYYSFDSGLYSLSAGTYRIQYVQPVGYGFTKQNAGTDASKDSDPDVGTGFTAWFTASAGAWDKSRDAGLLLTNVTGKIAGPSTVPGNSRYNYLARVDGNPAPTAYSFSLSCLDPVGADPSLYAQMQGLDSVYDAVSNTTLFRVSITMHNASPAQVRLQMINNANNTAFASKDITIVQVIVGIDLYPQSQFVKYPETSDGKVIIGGTVIVDGKEKAEIAAKADVHLVGIGADHKGGVNQIVVGYQQQVTIVNARATYSGGTGNRAIVSDTEGSFFLDCVGLGETRPWYTNSPFAMIDGASDTKKQIVFNDSPRSPYDLTWQSSTMATIRQAYPSVNFVTGVAILDNFSLFVSAQTKDTECGANMISWSEAQADWIYYATRGITGTAPHYANNNVMDYFNLTWAMPDPSFIAFTNAHWAVTQVPTPVQTDMKVANTIQTTHRNTW